MLLVILIPLFMLVAATGIVSLMLDDPDNVLNNHAPYGEICRSYEVELERVG